MSHAEMAVPANRALDLLAAPDQARIRTELRAFFGPKAEYFLDTYEQMRNGPNGPRLYPITWCWPAFLTGFTWFFYRKRHVEGMVIMLVAFLAETVLDLDLGVSIAAWAVLAVFAKTHYVGVGLRRLLKADALGLTGDDRLDYLRYSGGVSTAGGTIASVLYFSLLVISIVAAVQI